MGKLYLITGDIIECSNGMDAIVNAQNKYMAYGGGICGAIYNASGNELEQYCRRTYEKHMEVGEVRITPGFNLKMDIIHIYAPIFYEWEKTIDKLIESYDNLLNEAIKNKYKKILLPSLGTGFHGYQHQEVSEQVIKKLYDFTNTNDIEVYFINRFSIDTNTYFEELLKLKEFTQEELFEILQNEEYCYYDFIEGNNSKDLNPYEKLVELKVKSK